MKKGLKRLTREMLMAWEPCYDDEGIDDIAGKRRRSMSVTQVSALQIDAEDRLWVLAHWIAEFGARPARLFACDCAEALSEALCRVEGLCEVIRTARRFANRHATRREMFAVELGSFTWLGVGSSGSFDSVLVGKIAPLIRGTVEAVFTYESGVQVGLMIQDGRVAKCGVELRLVKPEGWE